MTQQVSNKLDFSRKLLLGAAGLVVVAVPIVFGLVGLRAQILSEGWIRVGDRVVI